MNLMLSSDMFRSRFGFANVGRGKFRLAFSVSGLLLAFTCQAVPYVTNVVARQRQPWNGLVDVSYEIVGSTNGMEYVYGQLTATDRTRGKTYVGSTFEKKIDLAEGKHTAIWNMAADSSFASKDVVFNMSVRVSSLYCVIDLSGGPNATSYPVSEFEDAPADGWSEEYKTTKLVMRRCQSGVDPLGRYTLTKAFYAGVFEVTQKQWTLVMGSNPSDRRYGSDDTCPIQYVSYDDIRGATLGSKWPESSLVDATSFIGRLRTKTGMRALDLPTEAQWEYACRAGTATSYNLGDDESALAVAGWYSSNASSTTHSVGQKTANAWGLYDMHGNVWELCLDWYGGNLLGRDPVGSASGLGRACRGGCWHNAASYCMSSHRGYDRCPDNPSGAYYDMGFRLFRTLP